METSVFNMSQEQTTRKMFQVGDTYVQWVNTALAWIRTTHMISSQYTPNSDSMYLRENDS